MAYGGYHGHHSHHGHFHHRGGGNFSGLGYFFLGVAGLLVLSHYLNRSSYNQGMYERSYPPPPSNYPQTVAVPKQGTPVIPPPAPLPQHAEDAGWQALATGTPEQALDIFAVQSQQNIRSGIPEIGFALAAAANNEPDRAARAMRKAVRTDADALEALNPGRELVARIEGITQHYQAASTQNRFGNDRRFLLAAMYYIKHDYPAAERALAADDQQESSVVLRRKLQDKLTN